MSADPNRRSLQRALQQDPDEFLAEHTDDLRRLREEVDSDRIIDVIDAVLADLQGQEGSP